MSFFELYLGRSRSLGEKLRLALGRLFHVLFIIPDLIRGASRESPMLVEVADGVVLSGRADAMIVRGDELRIVERKSSKAPRRGAWVSDVLQASAYGFILIRKGRANRVLIEIRYPTASRLFELDESLTSMLLRAVDDLILVKRYGIVPMAKRGSRCLKCPFKDICYELDKELAVEEGEVVEPGHWLADVNVFEQGVQD